MNDVRINGVRYVPQTSRPSSNHVNKLSSILAKECPYLSRNVRDNIVKKFEFGDGITKQKSNKSSHKHGNVKTKHKSKKEFSINNFKDIDEKGYVLFKQGKHPKSHWTIYQASAIRQWLEYGKFNSKTDMIEQLSKKYDLTESIVRSIIYNIEHGKFSAWLDDALIKNADIKTEEMSENKDMGWF